LAIGLRGMAKMDAKFDRIYQNEAKRQTANDGERPGRSAPQSTSDRGWPGAADSLSQGRSVTDTERPFRALMIQHIVARNR